MVICGQPCSGKSTAAAAIAAALRERTSLAVTVVDEPSLHIERDAGYAGANECFAEMLDDSLLLPL